MNTWEELWKHQGFNNPWIQPHAERHLLSRIRTNSYRQALDIGCGHGVDSFYMSEYGINTVGIDISETAIKYCNEMDSLASFVCGDFATYTFTDQFDFVYDRGYFGLMDTDKEKTAKKINRILQDGGHWLSLIGRYTSDDDVQGPPRYKLRELLEWTDSWLDVLEIKNTFTVNKDNDNVPMWAIVFKKK